MIPILNVDKGALKLYYKQVKEVQVKCDIEGHNIKLPPVPEHASRETYMVIKAYRNMVLVWDRCGGAAPDPVEYLELLWTMAANGIMFSRRMKGPK